MALEPDKPVTLLFYFRNTKFAYFSNFINLLLKRTSTADYIGIKISTGMHLFDHVGIIKQWN